MQTSESIKQISKSLVKAQSEIGGAVKDKQNTFFNSSYATLGAVIEAAKPSLTENKLCVIQNPYNEANAVGIATVILHESGEYIAERFAMPWKKVDPTEQGKLISYARRYALMSMLNIPMVDNDFQSKALVKGFGLNYTEEEKEIFDACIENDDARSASALEQTSTERAQIDLYKTIDSGMRHATKQKHRKLVRDGEKMWREIVKDVLELVEAENNHDLSAYLENYQNHERKHLGNLIGEDISKQIYSMLND